MPTLTDTPSRKPDSAVPRVRVVRRAVNVPGAVLPAEPATAANIGAHVARRRDRPTPPHSGIGAGEIPDDVRAMLPRWTARSAWLRTVRSVARTEAFARQCKDKHVGNGIAVATCLAALEVMAETADTETGELRASMDALGDRLGRSAKTIQRAKRVASTLGLLLEVYAARDLSGSERRTLVNEHGRHPQRGIPNVWQLAMIPPATRVRFSTAAPGRFIRLKTFVHLPPKGVRSPLTHLWELVTTAAADAARESEAAPPPLRPRGRRPGSALGIELLQSPHQRLIAGVTPGRLAGLLAPYQYGGWRGDDLALVLTEEARSRGWDTTRPARAPLAALKALLTRVDPIADPTTAWAPEPCEHCHHSPGRLREDLPLGPASVCTPCWITLSRPTEPVCTNPECDRGYISVTQPGHIGQTTITRCPSCAGEF